MTDKMIIHEVGLRDGLQMEHQTVPLEVKGEWLNMLIASGVDIIQLGSFVHPEKVPQMADTDRLFREFSDKPRGNVVFSGLVLNERGLERGLSCGVELFCMGVSASETHSRKNTGMTVGEATNRIIGIAQEAEKAGKKVQVSVQSAFGCGYEGPVPQKNVIRIVEQYIGAGLTTISLADTAGHATPDRVERMFETIRRMSDDVTCACHFHNTYGLGLANTYAAMKAGVAYFESSVAGLGGCPFTKIAGGNVCTDDFVHMLHQMCRRRDIDLQKLLSCAAAMSEYFRRELPGTVYRTGAIPRRETVV